MAVAGGATIAGAPNVKAELAEKPRQPIANTRRKSND